jgi:DNA-binding response OmpR family regulator
MDVAILQDERSQSNLIAGWLANEGYQVSHCFRVDAFVSLIKAHPFQMLIISGLFPDSDGFSVLSVIRKQLAFKNPVLFISPLQTKNAFSKALSLGADDCMVEPVRKKDLLSRMWVLKHRVKKEEVSRNYHVGPFLLDTNSRIAYVDGQPVKLTSKEFELACCIFSSNGELLSREYLLRAVWGVDVNLNTRTVDVHVSRLRRMLNIGKDTGYRIQTVYLHGYRLEKIIVDPDNNGLRKPHQSEKLAGQSWRD